MGITIDSLMNSSISNGAIKPAASTGSSLSVDDFFTLLSAQLSNQDMFNPVSDTEFIAQMAQFSTLEQIQQLTSAFQSNYAVTLVGKSVSALHTDSEGETQYVSGTVEGLVFSGSTPYLSVNGVFVEAGDIVAIVNTPQSSQTQEDAEDTTVDDSETETAEETGSDG